MSGGILLERSLIVNNHRFKKSFHLGYVTSLYKNKRAPAIFKIAPIMRSVLAPGMVHDLFQASQKIEAIAQYKKDDGVFGFHGPKTKDNRFFIYISLHKKNYTTVFFLKHSAYTMKINPKTLDAVLNIVVPLCLGVLVYVIRGAATIPVFFKNYVADGLWAYAFISSLLIIWGRKMNLTWMLVPFGTSAVFEWLQYRHTLPGTGDVLDVITYCLFFMTSILLNTYFKNRFQT
jgi:hypothetical protein